MSRYLRWSTCALCGKKITQNKTAGRWHDALGDWNAKSAACSGSAMGHSPREKAAA